MATANVQNNHINTHHLAHHQVHQAGQIQIQGQGHTHHHHHIHHFYTPTVVQFPGQAHPVLVIDQWVPTAGGVAYIGPPVPLWSLPHHPQAQNQNPGPPQQPQQQTAPPMQLVNTGPTPPPSPH